MTISDDHRREMMKKRLIGILLSFALMMVMLPVLGMSQTAYADVYDLWVGGIRVTSTNASDILGDRDEGITASYDNGSNTLTLNNYSYESPGYEFDLQNQHYAAIYAGQELNIQFKGNNTVKCTEQGGASIGNGIHVYGTGNELIISGSGTLEAGGYGIGGMGIYAVGGDIKIKGGTVNALSNNGNAITTDKSGGSVIINSGIVTASGSTSFSASYVTVADDMGINAGDGKETAIDVDKTEFINNHTQKWVQVSKAYPLWVRGTRVMVANETDVLGDSKVSYDPDTHTLTLDGANITADNEKQYKYSAIHYRDADNDLIIDATKDSTVTGASYDDTKEKTSYGISSESRVTVRGKLTAAGGKASSSYGVFVPDFVVEDKAEAKVLGSTGGVCITDKGSSITVRGKLTAEGGDYGIYFYPDSTGSGRVTSVTVNSGAELTVTGGVTGIVSNSSDGYVEIKKGAKGRAVGAGIYGCGAVDGIVKNAVPGLGWTDPEGTEGKTFFDIVTQGRELGENIKCAEFPAPAASVKTAPEAKDRKYTGQEQVLVTEGKAEGGTMQYALGKDGTTPPERGWSTSVPAGKDIGVYYVWYKAVGDNAHIDSAAACVTVTISEKGPDPDESTVTFDLNGGTLDGQTGTVVKKYENGTVITLPAPVRDGYTFDYWEGSRYNAGDKYTVDGDHTFTAVWKTGAGGGSDSGTGSGSSSGKSGVKTGDDNALAAWIVLLLAALGGTTGMVFARKRKGE